MSSRDFAVVALGRFLVVERYRETCPSPPNDRLPFPGPDWSGGYGVKRDSSVGPQVPARPRRG